MCGGIECFHYRLPKGRPGDLLGILVQLELENESLELYPYLGGPNTWEFK